MSQLSTAVRNAELNAVISTIGTAAVLRFYSGALPATTATARSGTLAASLTLPSTYFAAASGGASAQAGTWSGTISTQAIIGYYSFYDSGVTTVHIQGTVGCVAWAASTAYTIGQTRTNGGNAYQVTTAGTSAASGGPTGTGTGITDGSVVWSYLAAAVATPDMTLDNINPSSGSTLTLTGETLTAAGA